MSGKDVKLNPVSIMAGYSYLSGFEIAVILDERDKRYYISYVLMKIGFSRTTIQVIGKT